MLEEVCLKNGWGTPTYDLLEAVGVDSRLYVYKVCCRNCVVVRDAESDAELSE